MKLTKQLRSEILDVYEAFWGSLFNVDIEIYTRVLDDHYRLIGTTDKEVFFNKKEAISFLKQTAEQLAGNIERRKSRIKIEPVDTLVLITEQFDAYVMIGNDWTFYGSTRVSTWMQQRPGGWKLAQQHFSFTDTKAEEGQTIGLEKITKENVQLREAVKRRTAELENKNRELEIEAALERVRAVAMGMKQPKDMIEICGVISKQLSALGVKEIRNVQTAIFYKKGTYMNYEYYAKHKKTIITEVDYTGNKVHKDQKKFAETMMASEGSVYTKSFKGQKLTDWFAYQKTTNQMADKFLLTAHSLNYYWFSLGPVALGISTYYPLTKEEIDLFLRFKNVFDLAYRRYLDIEKAETQAREAQVEAALERVRSQSMAMRNSEELKNVVKELRKQIGLLGQKELDTCVIQLYDESPDDIYSWVSMTPSIKDEEIRDFYGQVPKKGLRIHEEALQAYSTGRKDYTLLNKGKKLEQWIGFLKENYPEAYSVIVQTVGSTPERVPVYWSFSDFNGGSLLMVTQVPPADVSKALLRRFANVFGLAYRRFADLKQAEAQAREAQIEAALEKVRSRSLAMHHSNELEQVVICLFDRLADLGLSFDGALIFLFDKNKRYIQLWIATTHLSSAVSIDLPYDEEIANNAIIKDLWDAIENNEQVFNRSYSGDTKNDYFRYVAKYNDSKVPQSVRQLQIERDRWTISFATEKNLAVGFDTWSGHNTTKDDFQILIRFTRVFEQAYTRFLDLQKAEAQAREAKIDAALERTRTQSMVMQHSEDLNITSQVFHQQLLILGIETEFTYLWLPDEEKNNHLFWATWPEQQSDSTIYKNKALIYALDKTEPATAECFRAWRSGVQVHTYTVLPSEVENYFATWKDLVEGGEKLKPEFFSEGFYYVEAFMKYGCFGLFIRRVFTEEEKKILGRFAIEFERAYTRFLDLKKAEAQAREARIEAALEKVRSRSLAMHKSDEIEEVLHTLFEKLKELDIDFYTAIIILFEKGSKDVVWWLKSKANHPFRRALVPYTDIEYLRNLFEARQNGTELISNCYPFEEKNKLFHHLFDHTDLKNTPEEQKEFLLKTEFATISVALEKNTAIHITSYSRKSFSEQDNEVFKRFAKVFEQAYTRFLDLQKAEAQAREAQMEAALERVRSRTMGMQKSEELKEVIQVVYEQFVHLNILIEHTGFIMDYKARNDMHIWLADQHKVPSQVTIPYFDCAHWNSFNEAKEKGLDFFANHLSFEEKNRFYQDLFKLIPGVPEETLEYYFSCQGLAISTVLLDNVGLYIENFSGIPYTAEENNTLMRFGKVFQQTYTRFLDLQKAEAQAREAQIEAALERVRSRTMAMQRSSELAEVATLLFQQVKALGVPQWTCGFCIFEIDDKEATWYPGGPDGEILAPAKMPLTEHPIFIQMNESRKRGDELYIYEKTGEVQADHYRYMMTVPGLRELLQNYLDAGLSFPTFQIDHLANFSHGILIFITYEHFPEMHDIFKRFAKVFEQTYTRFLDLQKAEAQARESQIQLALERVRARTMAMQRSDELSGAASLLFQQVQSLGAPSWTAGYCIWDEDKKAITLWMSSPGGDSQRPFRAPLDENPTFIRYLEANNKGLELYIEEESGKVPEVNYQYLLTLPVVGEQLKAIMKEGYPLPTYQVDHCAYFSKGFLLFITYQQVPELHDIFKRFAAVFDQTYTRFLDLQKAEAQAREAKIEAAMEKVRSRTMAMQRSAELAEVATVLFQQVKALGVHQWTCGFGIFEIDDKEFTWYQGSEDGNVLPPCKIPLTEHPVFIQFNESRKRGDELYVYEKTGELQTDHYRYMCSLPVLGKLMQDRLDAGLQFPTFQIDHVAPFSHGNLVFITYEPFPEMHDVFKRFAKVFDQTYTRFLDLQRAEAQAIEAVKQASVDRVRAEIASMRTTSDLERITPLIWNELTTLGVPFIRCGVFIMDEEQEQVQSFLSTPDGKAIAAFRQPYNSPGEISLIVEHWRQKKMYRQHWNEAQFIEFTKNLVQQGAITSGEKYLTENRPTDLYLHFLPFIQGMLYAGSTTALSDDELRLMQDLADAFSTAYARYEDFNKLEAAKETVEQTLVDLKQAQQQLVQSEKMASLGELTAGIAHEIQNPLNFVNNFSEVNRELLSEMKAEIEKGNIEEVKAIASDIIGNEEKINHHGKRADAIVKGMLQHSRTGGGQKELTDINALCDEYLRLAYHGLRAKDKSFNAKFETNLDNSIGKINIIPQDIGRVLVNLINNAFYAVSEKQKHASAGLPAGQAGSAPNGYEPSVLVTSKKDGDGIELSVTDNGSGIPQKVLDKIFQPFFTTKPTGQGTGLGLSLAYDIIKTHNGEIKVESKETEGTTFIIRLPENS